MLRDADIAFAASTLWGTPRKSSWRIQNQCSHPRRRAVSTARATLSHPLLVPAERDDADDWDGEAVCGAIVRRFEMDDGERWFMWYGGHPRQWNGAQRVPSGIIGCLAGLATSADGIKWERVRGPASGGAILVPNEEDWWWFDTAHLAIGHVDILSNPLVRSDGGVYFAYYSGGDTEKVVIKDKILPGARTCIGVALSKDGEHWTRVEGEFPSGAVLEPGPEGAFDSLGVLGPSIVQLWSSSGQPSEYLMYYFAFDVASGTYAIGRARSSDGFKFTRDLDGVPVLKGSGIGSGTIDEKGVSRCCIVERDRNQNDGHQSSRYVMFVEVIDALGVHRIAVSESSDALTWSPRQLVLDVAPSETEWDAGSVSHPCVVIVKGEAWLFYTGQSKPVNYDSTLVTTGIGLAVSRGGDWSKFDRFSPEILKSNGKKSS